MLGYYGAEMWLEIVIWLLGSNWLFNIKVLLKFDSLVTYLTKIVCQIGKSCIISQKY